MASGLVCSGPKTLVLEFCTITTGRIGCRFDSYDLFRHQLKGGRLIGYISELRDIPWLLFLNPPPFNGGRGSPTPYGWELCYVSSYCIICWYIFHDILMLSRRWAFTTVTSWVIQISLGFLLLSAKREGS